MPGPVCITMDGLMMYLTHEQQASVLQNIKAILQKHGGCYITTDFSAHDFVMDASKVVYGAKHAHEVYRKSAKVYEDIADADFDEKFFANDEEATRFITAQSFLFYQPHNLHCRLSEILAGIFFCHGLGGCHRHVQDRKIGIDAISVDKFGIGKGTAANRHSLYLRIQLVRQLSDAGWPLAHRRLPVHAALAGKQ